MPIDLEPASLIAGLLVSSLGFGLFVYGKKQGRGPQLLGGIVLMALPVVVPGAWLQYGAAGVVTLGVWLAVRAGC